MPKDLVALHAITHKPKTKVEKVNPGAMFTPADDAERDYLLRNKAAREPTEAELGGGAKKPAAKKPAAKKPAADPAPAAAPDKAVTLDPTPGTDESGDGDLLA